MGRIDDRRPAVAVEERQRRALSRFLAGRDDVTAAYLFGSQARGEAGPLSDVDVAVWLDPDLDRSARSRRQLELMAGAAGVLSTDEVQVVVLNDAPPLLVNRALRDGELLSEHDRAVRVRLETEALVRYLDTAPLREELARGLGRRLGDGSFGRPRSR
jgi:predicted nucleotidyltransferase